MTITALLAEQMSRHAKTFLKALEEFPEAQFHTDLPAGGHSAAWHALHIADWTRILVPAGLVDVPGDARFSYLGWEDAAFAQKNLGDSPAMLSSSKPEILEYLGVELERATRDVTAMDDTRLEERIVVPMGERVVKAILLTQIGHVPYHYGQMRMNLKQLVTTTT
jgi:uncharacterized damage-inducible protein DinB